MAKETENKRIECEGLEPAEVLALGRAMSDAAKPFKEAREQLATGVFPVDFCVRITGDVEVGVAEEQPEKFDSQKYLIAALVALGPTKRAEVLANPDVPKEKAAIVKGEIEAVKAVRPMKPTSPKLTAHVATVLVERYEHVAVRA